MIPETGHEIAVTSGMASLGSSCTLLHRFIDGSLQGDDYLQLLFHLDQCPRCYDRVRSFPQQKREQLYALKSGLEEVVLEEAAADQDTVREEEEATPFEPPGCPPETAAREELSHPKASAYLSHVATLLEQEMRAAEHEIEEMKANLSAMEGRRTELRADLEHVQAARRIIAKVKDPAAPKAIIPVTFVRSRMNFAALTQRQAILQVLSQNPSQPLNKKSLTQALVEGGFPFRAVERTERQNAVYQTCRRMVEGRELLMTIDNRDAFYRLASCDRAQTGHHDVARAAG